MNKRGTSGAVAIEFALVGLAFVSLLLLAMETGWQLLIDSALGAGARAASRFGSRFLKVNFSGKKQDLGFALMNQLSVAESEGDARHGAKPAERLLHVLDDDPAHASFPSPARRARPASPSRKNRAITMTTEAKTMSCTPPTSRSNSERT